MCPFGIGDIICNKGTGKIKYIIDKIVHGRWKGEDYRLHGRKIKKDGSPYKETTMIWQLSDPIKVK